MHMRNISSSDHKRLPIIKSQSLVLLPNRTSNMSSNYIYKQETRGQYVYTVLVHAWLTYDIFLNSAPECFEVNR